MVLQAVPRVSPIFIARDLELARLNEALAQVSVALIYGVAGVGKSSLALAHAAHSNGPVVYRKAASEPLSTLVDDVRRHLNGSTLTEALSQDVPALRDSLFEKSFRREQLIECGCNMHGRRYFKKALDGGDARAALPIAAFKKLYELEEEIRDRGPEVKREQRQLLSKPVYDELVAWCRAHRPQEPPSSPMAKAIGYLLNNEQALQRFLDDGVVPIDNGIVERLHVRTALTRKNYLFAGSDAGAERAAIAYTLLGCCELANVDPVAYLADVLPRLSRRVRITDMPMLLPAGWEHSGGAPAASSSATARL